ncbi:MAG TPA: DUF6089 family protein [Saprospiraceae bacterium]|nr:DUF6089 family protein [Saprospiraceae bacterium]
MKAFRFILGIFMLCIALVAQSQNFGAGIVLGACQYKGDLSDKTETLTQNLRFAKGITFTYDLHRTMDFSASFINTYMQAYDKDADSPDRQKRNLHFRSALNELSLCFHFYPVSLFTKKEHQLKPFIKTGIGVFSFNPKAEYQGEWVRLQPLHTEGQGMPLSGLNAYSLVDISYPFGLGLEYTPWPFLKIRAEISPRKTYTDYLDDVSGNYYDLNGIKKYSSDLAAQLAYREVEWNIDNPPAVAGIQRGNAENNDWYIIHQLSVYYMFGAKKTAIPEAGPPIPAGLW